MKSRDYIYAQIFVYIVLFARADRIRDRIFECGEFGLSVESEEWSDGMRRIGA